MCFIFLCSRLPCCGRTPRSNRKTLYSWSSISLISPYSHAHTKTFPPLNQDPLLKEEQTRAALTQEEGTALIWTDSPWQSLSWCHTEWEYPCIAAKLELWSLLSFSYSVFSSFSYRLSVHTWKWDQSQGEPIRTWIQPWKLPDAVCIYFEHRRVFLRESFDIGWKRG